MGILAVSDVVWQAVIGACVTIILAWMQARSTSQITGRVNDIGDQVEVVRHATNSLTEQLVAKSEAEGILRGREEGRVAEQQRTDAKKS